MSDDTIRDGGAEVDDLLAQGDVRTALEALTEAARATGDPVLYERLVALRHAGFARVDPSPQGAIAVPAAGRFVPGQVPEVGVAELSPEVLAAGLTQCGSLLVRGLLGAGDVAALLDDVHRAFEAGDASADGADRGATSPWFVPFEATEGYSFGAIERHFARSLGGTFTVESPRTLADLVAAFRRAGLGDLLAGYFGEWPALSAKKSTLRRARPHSPTEWHQDGAFLGASTRSVNVWLALTDCGVDAPGIDIVPRAFDHIVTRGGEGALFDWSVSPADADRSGGIDPLRPVFAPGDALLFDQLTLHRTGLDPSMTRDRYALESWFFAPSTYPHEQVPVLF